MDTYGYIISKKKEYIIYIYMYKVQIYHPFLILQVKRERHGGPRHLAVRLRLIRAAGSKRCGSVETSRDGIFPVDDRTLGPLKKLHVSEFSSGIFGCYFFLNMVIH